MSEYWTVQANDTEWTPVEMRRTAKYTWRDCKINEDIKIIEAEPILNKNYEV
jgi:hypothetical protein